MEVIKYTVENNFQISKFFLDLISKHNLAVFDIETTGLNPSYSKVILIGLLYFEDTDIVIEQYFCDASKYEKELLESFIDRFNYFDLYITFNGSSFDIPFLNKRLKKNSIEYEIDSYLNIDLCKVARQNKKTLGLKNCKLKTVEDFLGIYRDDTISGAESVELYKKYEASQDQDIKDKILLHNFEDILHLVPLLNIINHIPLNRFIKNFPHEFIVNDSSRIRIIDYHIKNDFLEINGEFIGPLKKDILYYNSNYDMTLDKSSRTLFIRVPLIIISNKDFGTYTFLNIDKLSFGKMKLSETNDNERHNYLVKINNEINHYNIFIFLKKFIEDIFINLNL